MRYFSFCSVLLLGILGFSQSLSAKAKEYYTNPDINQSAPDPTVIRSDDGTYYLYATENVRNLPIFKSHDLVNWELIGTAFTNDTRPKMVPDGNIWAPDIQLIDGRYVLYYSKSKWGGEWECGIGVAVADSPEGPISLNMMDITTLSVRQEHAATGSEAPIVWLWPGRKTFLGHT